MATLSDEMNGIIMETVNFHHIVEQSMESNKTASLQWENFCQST